MRQGRRSVVGWARRAGIVLVIAAGVSPAFARAATLTVPTTAETSASVCTLPAAITAANINSDFDGCHATGYGNDTINITATGTIALTGQLPGITSNLAIDGPGAGQLDVHRQDNASGPFRIFHVGAGNTVSISDLAISNGLLTNTSQAGAGVQNLGTLTLDRVVVAENDLVITSAMTSGGPAPTGGGIANLGTMTLSESTVTENSVSATNTGGTQAFADASGGGVMNFGTLTVRRSTISDNQVVASVQSNDGLSSSFAAGAGLRNWVTSGTGVVMRLSTISGNTVSAVAPAPSFATELGGGIYNFAGSLSLTSNTVAGNVAEDAANLSGQATESVTNTIISDPVGGPNCDANTVETDGGFNLTFPTPCPGLTALDTDPVLGPLAPNGGPTLTRELGAGSAAVDQGTSAGNVTDQRAMTRPVDIPAIANADDGADIGALEAQDSDGDGVIDGADSCPDLDGAGTASGCPAITRELTLRYSKRRERFKGLLTASGPQECADAREVSVWRRKPGPDKRVGEATTSADGVYKLPKDARRGRYHSTVDLETLEDIADCGAARSAVVTVR